MYQNNGQMEFVSFMMLNMDDTGSFWWPDLHCCLCFVGGCFLIWFTELERFHCTRVISGHVCGWWGISHSMCSFYIRLSHKEELLGYNAQEWMAMTKSGGDCWIHSRNGWVSTLGTCGLVCRRSSVDGNDGSWRLLTFVSCVFVDAFFVSVLSACQLFLPASISKLVSCFCGHVYFLYEKRKFADSFREMQLPIQEKSLCRQL